jgi:hypothetical protein
MLEQLWSEFDSLPFPDRIPRDVRDGVDLELLDDEASACVQVFLATGVLDSREVGVLRACRTELLGVLPRFRGDAAEYFRRLEQLCALVLNRVDGARPAL